MAWWSLVLRTKNGDSFALPIPSAHRELFESDDVERVFPLARVKGKPFTSHKRLTEAVRPQTAS